MSSVIRINFCDFWGHFVKEDNYFFHLLSKRYQVEITDNPDFVIYSGYGDEHLKYNCFRIFYNGENERINWNACDYALSFEFLTDRRHYRLPNWVLYDDPQKLVSSKPDPEAILRQKKSFCNMVVSNPRAPQRINFFHKLSKYKKVDSGGRYLNNIGGPLTDKRSFIRDYKFTIAFENSSYPGYTTEKIFEPMLENSIPLYWGSTLVGSDFNTRSFLNFNDYVNEDAFIEKIIEVDKNDDLYLKMLSEPWYNDNVMPENLKEDRILDYFDDIIRDSQVRTPVAQDYHRWLYSAKRQFAKADFKLNSIFNYRKPFR